MHILGFPDPKNLLISYIMVDNSSGAYSNGGGGIGAPPQSNFFLGGRRPLLDFHNLKRK
jgi:hypothetical protein